MRHATKELEIIAADVRQDIIKMILKAGAGHPAGSLGVTDLVVCLYYEILNGGDKFILSAGHLCPARYAVMAKLGLIDKNVLNKLGEFGSILQGHPDKRFLPSLETTSGPLGSGLAQACGIAYAARMDKARFRTFVICSDGEHGEGNHWETVAFAGKNNLSNLTLFIDRNNIQIDGFTEDVMPLEPLADKYRAFNWAVIEIDGHNFEEIVNAVNKARAIYENPTAIIARTIPGKGVDFMELEPGWHAKVPNKEQTKKALEELRSMQGKIKKYGE